MSKHITQCHFVVATALVCMMSLIFTGCDSGIASTNNNSGQATNKRARSFTFHKPREFNTAITRIRELHDVISGSDALPDPIEYQVKEVVHGSGVNAHSHFFFYDPTETEEHDFGEEEEHETTEEKIIDVKVDPFVELYDVVRWLPKIASGGDMPESDWVQVNEISKELTPALKSVLDSAADTEKQRAGYQEKVDSFDSQISTLEELVK